MKHRFQILVKELPPEDIEKLAKVFKDDADLIKVWGG